jgi:hypothetical protein
MVLSGVVVPSRPSSTSSQAFHSPGSEAASLAQTDRVDGMGRLAYGTGANTLQATFLKNDVFTEYEAIEIAPADQCPRE